MKEWLAEIIMLIRLKNAEKAFKFTSNNEERLRHFEELLKYEPYTLEFREI